jgi:hypothetical protein
MKKGILVMAMALVMALFSSGPIWAGNGQGNGQALGSSQGIQAQDGSMLNVDLSDTITINGVVYEAGVAGTGMSIDTGDEIVTVYGIGSLNFWSALEVERPAVGENVEVDAIEVVFSDGSTRLIAVSMTLSDGTIVTLRDEDGKPAWRGSQGQGQGLGDGTGTCPQTIE